MLTLDQNLGAFGIGDGTPVCASVPEGAPAGPSEPSGWGKTLFGGAPDCEAGYLAATWDLFGQVYTEAGVVDTTASAADGLDPSRSRGPGPPRACTPTSPTTLGSAASGCSLSRSRVGAAADRRPLPGGPDRTRGIAMTSPSADESVIACGCGSEHRAGRRSGLRGIRGQPKPWHRPQTRSVPGALRRTPRAKAPVRGTTAARPSNTCVC